MELVLGHTSPPVDIERVPTLLETFAAELERLRPCAASWIT